VSSLSSSPAGALRLAAVDGLGQLCNYLLSSDTRARPPPARQVSYGRAGGRAKRRLEGGKREPGERDAIARGRRLPATRRSQPAAAIQLLAAAAA